MARPRRILDREVVFFGGKGGVGKTTLAATMALEAAREGHRTLLVSTDPAHSTSDVLETRLGGTAREVRPRLWALEIDPGEEADRYIDDVKARIADSTPPRLMAEVERQIDIARVTPGAEESALFDRFTRLAEEAGQDIRPPDLRHRPAGAHAAAALAAGADGCVDQRAHLAAQEGQRARAHVAQRGGRGGRRRGPGEDPVLGALTERQARFRHARALITDPHRTGFVFVVTPEHLPVAETERSVKMLDKYGIPVAAIFLNQVVPEDADGALLGARRERQARYIRRVREAFAAHPVHEVPLMDGRLRGLEGLERLGRMLPASERRR